MKPWTLLSTILTLCLLAFGCKFTDQKSTDLRSHGSEEAQGGEAEAKSDGDESQTKSKANDEEMAHEDMKQFPPNGSFALQFSNLENPNYNYVVSNDPFLEEMGSRWIQVQDTSHSDTASLYLQINAVGDHRLIYWAGEELGYINVENGDLLICGRYNPFGTVMLEALGCKAIGNLSQIESDYYVTYENGERVRSGNTYYHSDGYTFISSSGTWYFRNGSTLKSSAGTLYWPSGYTMKSTSSDVWRYRDGSYLKSGDRLYYYYSSYPFNDGFLTQYANGDDMLGTSTHNLIYWGQSRYLTDNGNILDYDGDYIKSGSTIYWDNDTYEAPFRRSVRRNFNGSYIHVDIEATKTSDFIVITEHETDNSGLSAFLMRKNGSSDLGVDGYAEIDVFENGGLTRIPIGGHLDIGTEIVNTQWNSEPFLIQNTGLSDLVISNIEILPVGEEDDTDFFWISGINTPYTLAPGDTTSATIVMDRTRVKSGRVKVRVTSNDTTNPVWEFTAMGSMVSKLGDGLTGHYFNNITLSGAPTVTRVDAGVTFDWGEGNPMAGIPSDAFSIRWLGQVYAPFSGEYRFFVHIDDGARLWINNQLIIDDWVPNPWHESGGTITLEAGKRYDIKLEYFESPGYARVFLGWSPPQVGPNYIPSDYLFTRYLPNAPTNLSASAASSAAISLNWQDTSPHETSYIVQQSTDGSTFNTIATLPADTTSYFVDGLAASTSYYFKVFANNTEGDSSAATAVTQTLGIPTAPANFTATAQSHTSILLQWEDTADSESGFALERSTDGISYTERGTLDPDTQSFLDEGLTAQTTYYYRLKAISPGGDSSSVQAQELALVAPAAPTNLTANVLSATEIMLSWEDNASQEANFVIQTSTDGQTFTDAATLPSNTQAHALTGLTAGTSYTVRVHATNTRGDSDSAEVNAETYPLPTVPDTFTATAISAQLIRLDWNDSSTYENHYIVERSLDGVSFTDLATLSANTTTYQDNGLTENTTYHYRLRASSTGGDSGTIVAQATTLSFPEAPINLVVTPISSQAIRLDWQDQSDDETSFRIARSEDGTTYSPVGVVSTNTTTYTDTELTPETAYYYHVFAVSQGGLSTDAEGQGTTPAESATPDPIVVPPTPGTSADGWLEAQAVITTQNGGSFSGSQSSLPVSPTWVDEWTSYNIELWVKPVAAAPTSQVTLSTIIDYDAEHATPGSITFANAASSFSNINDVNGSMTVDMVMDLNQMEIGNYYLVGVVRMESTPSDVNIPVPKYEKPVPAQIAYHFLGSRVVTNESGTYALNIGSVQVERWPVVYDADDSNAINYRDLIFLSAIYGVIPNENSMYSYAFDFDGNNSVNYRDLTFLAAVYGKSRDNWSPTYPANFPAHYNE